MTCLLAIDQSTSASKALLFDAQGSVLDQASREHRQHYPQPGWVEHDAEEIWQNVLAAAREVVARQGARLGELAGVSLTNQRETFVVFERATGAPLHPAIVWQCRRGDELCAAQIDAGRESAMRAKTGLKIDSYFPASKLQWLLRAKPELARKLAAGEALVGTIDSYLIYRLTRGKVFATDHTNASRTLLFDIGRLAWDDELCALWEVPRRALAVVRPSAARFGETDLDGALPRAVPICGVMGDSQASLFAQRCFEPGSAKVTFGTGSSVLLNIGATLPPTNDSSLTALAWVHDGQPTYALEGVIIASASTLTWLRDQLGLISDLREIEAIARSVPDNGGVYLVPAFSGLGAPHWSEAARGAIVGLSAHSDRRHVVRAALESIAYQVRDVLEAMRAESGVALRRLHGDGGATTNGFLMQFVADLARVELRVAASPHLSPLGAAMMGMLGLGLVPSLDALAKLPAEGVSYRQVMVARDANILHSGWQQAVKQVLSATPQIRPAGEETETREGIVRRLTWMALLLALAGGLGAETVRVIIPPNAAPRVEYGARRLTEALRAVGTETALVWSAALSPDPADLVVGTIKGIDAPKESFLIAIAPGARRVVTGADDSGTLYGCLELARRIREAGRVPSQLQVTDHPRFVLRGPAIGMQKTFILPGRRVYEYPYTSELFPFFYEKEFWREYLDFLADNRMNTLYLWNGHPFASLVKLPEYPEALEVTEEQFKRNNEMFHYITQECDRRGIWLVQMFYNIFLPKPLAEKHGVESQLRASTPLAADYTRKALAAFVREYPNVGLMPCLGEALQGTPAQIEWATKTILPGVKDGMAAAGLKQEPPVVFRTHAMDPVAIMPEAFKVYTNLFTETKYNGESLTTWEPRGKSQETHLAMAKLGPHLVNVHILSNLEPFRYGATEFIRKSVLASRDRLGATGLHLYPLAYWNWPDAPDKIESSAGVPPASGAGGTPALRQWDRDWIWFEAWARYAWNPDVDPKADRAYWVKRLADRYGSTTAAALILDAYNDAGECAPRIIRRFGITEGNRQTMSLGMTLDELVNPAKYGEFPDLWESQAPPGERLQDYVEKEWKRQPHEGETPPQIVREVLEFSQRAVTALEQADPLVTKNREEFARLRNDAACIQLLSQNYGAKATAALHLLRFKRNGALAEMEQARDQLFQSLEAFRALELLTAKSYRFANTMQTAQRRIPFVGGAGGKPANYHWTQVLPLYEKEFVDFDAQVTALKSGGAAAAKIRTLATLRAVPFTTHTPNSESYNLRAGQRVFSDAPFTIEELPTELEGLRGYKFPRRTMAEQVPEISVTVPVRVLIGYVKSDAAEWRKAPRSEFDAAAAERGGTEPLLVNAAKISGLPDIDVYELTLPGGRHKIEPPGTGAFLVLGVVADEK